MTVGGPLAPEVLDVLRMIGDPGLTEVADSGPVRNVRRKGLLALGADDVGVPTPLPFPLDSNKLVVAKQLFNQYGTEIAGALLLAILPQSYAAERGAAVLRASEELERDPARRIRRTASFLNQVMGGMATAEAQEQRWIPGQASDEGVTPWRYCQLLRLYHQHLRQRLPRDDTPAVRRLVRAAAIDRATAEAKPLDGAETKLLNQEDLLTLLLSLSITVFEVLEQFGIAWSADEQEAYLHIWDIVGHYLGIGDGAVIAELDRLARPGHEHERTNLIPADWIGLRPPTVASTRALLAQLRVRQWPDVAPTGPLEAGTWSGARAGRALIKSLLDELSAAMPRPFALMPISIVRALAPDRVRTRLNLGGNGLVLGAVISLPKRRVLIDRFTSIDAPNRVGGRTLRMMANDVTARAAVRFMASADFDLAGLTHR